MRDLPQRDGLVLILRQFDPLLEGCGLRPQLQWHKLLDYGRSMLRKVRTEASNARGASACSQCPALGILANFAF